MTVQEALHAYKQHCQRFINQYDASVRIFSYLVSLHCTNEVFDSVAVVGQAWHAHQPPRGGERGGGWEETYSRRARWTGEREESRDKGLRGGKMIKMNWKTVIKSQKTERNFRQHLWVTCILSESALTREKERSLMFTKLSDTTMFSY